MVQFHVEKIKKKPHKLKTISFCRFHEVKFVPKLTKFQIKQLFADQADKEQTRMFVLIKILDARSGDQSGNEWQESAFVKFNTPTFNDPIWKA